MREIALDTETTGLDPDEGHRIVEIGCVEVINKSPTDNKFQKYINPEREVPAEAYAVHNISDEFLADKPLFKDIVDEFLEFIGDSPIVIHNSEFDLKFLNSELKNISYNPIVESQVIDTLRIAREKLPIGPYSLDALCNRYKIDKSKRTKHGALLDAELLAEVYRELCGGKQTALEFKSENVANDTQNDQSDSVNTQVSKARPNPLQSRLTNQEKEAHAKFIAGMGENAVWQQYQN